MAIIRFSSTYQTQTHHDPCQTVQANVFIGQAKIIKFPVQYPVVAPVCAPPTKRKRGNTQVEEQRMSMLAKIHMALTALYKKLPYFDEDFYRNELDRRFNLTERNKKCSAAELNKHELHEVLLWLAELGWKKQKSKRHNAPAELTHDDTGLSREAQLKKIEAMLAEKGRVEGTDVPWAYAVTILKNKSKGEVKSFKHAKSEHLDMVIAALYNDAKRKGRRSR